MGDSATMKAYLYDNVVSKQKGICSKYEADCLIPGLAERLGISASALEGKLPLNGLRHVPNGDTCGWYIWSGDYSADPGFFLPLHVEHVVSEFAQFVTYLGLPPGWRFMIGEGGYEDVWFDENLKDLA